MKTNWKKYKIRKCINCKYCEACDDNIWAGEKYYDGRNKFKHVRCKKVNKQAS